MPIFGRWISFSIIACTVGTPAIARAEAAAPEAPNTANAPAAAADPDPATAAASEASTPAASPDSNDANVGPKTRKPRKRWTIDVASDSFAVVNDAKGLSLHKPMFLLPATYSGRYPGNSSEVLFNLSLKLRVFDTPVYFAYSQKSFFQALNGDKSKPFRENNFNPEAFYRLVPDDENRAKWWYLASDFGIEHESNGKSLPDSRSWNRIYIAPYYERDNTLVYWKWWYRLPEEKNRAATDPKRDDNPDIQDYYGYTELQVQQRLFNRHQISATFRYNPTTARGAVGVNYTIPGKNDYFFWTFYLWQGYGESLLDYDRSVTRVGVGISLAR